MKTDSSRLVVRPGSEAPREQCGECGSQNLKQFNASSVECLDCTYEQSLMTYQYNIVDKQYIRGLST